jgi:hypothetical protein
MAVARDLRRFLVFRWTLLECRHRDDLNLPSVWAERFGFVPPFDSGAVAGLHFTVGGGRAVYPARPPLPKIPGASLAQVFTLIRDKHGAASVRLAQPHEVPPIPRLLRIDDPSPAAVEQWPRPRRFNEPLLIEYTGAEGWYIATQDQKRIYTQTIKDARTFAHHEDAERWLREDAPIEELLPRYLAAARAEEDQRRAALTDDGI